MKIEELATLMEKSVDEVKHMLENNEVIELKLSERNNKEEKESGSIEML